jgi:hypothetical protein
VITGLSSELLEQVFLFLVYFAEFRPETYDFDIHEGFFMKENPNSPDFKKKKISKSPDFCDTFLFYFPVECAAVKHCLDFSFVFSAPLPA